MRRSRRDQHDRGRGSRGEPPAPPAPELFRTRPDDRFKLTADASTLVRDLGERSAETGWLSPLGYNLTISHSHRFVWYRVAKVATRTVRHHFAAHSVTMDVDHAMRIHYPTSTFSDYFKFAFVRDPLDRFVSAWHDKVVNHNYFRFDAATYKRMQDVVEFARWVSTQDLAAVPGTDQHLALQTRLVDLSQVDFVGRLESFDRDFAEVCEQVGAPAVPANPQNQTAAPGQRREASAELEKWVRRMYRRDYQILGY
ncbi:sulfotransferase family 2 domain-containing protein [Nocardioides campestrisoli]|uniref:sulfotransferase family 2 domain-containing protein n=1 Tax=Nocardioides campestrisoli TaxID=2736757 RepID=UPI0015E663C3|nr:sulfotransferase family 2 domain-containing protein [Nocardioides campestrisoli]